jgi:hypothetical protein
VAGQVAEAQAREAQAREAQALETRALETRAEADAAAGASRRAREGRPPGRPLYVLVQQRPHRPGWEPAGESEIRWDVLTAADAAGGPPRVLVFSALPRAVRFMQPAVLAGLALVNRVGRFPAAVVADWGLPLELDPLFETLAAGGELRFPGPLLRVDHRRRVRDAEEHDAGGREAEEREAGERDGDEPGAGANG